MSKPTKTEIARLIEEMQNWQRTKDKKQNSRQVSLDKDTTVEKWVPDVKRVVAAFESRRFPVLDEFVHDPHQPLLADVMTQLGNARKLLK